MEAIEVEVKPYANGHDIKEEPKQVENTLLMTSGNWTSWCFIPQLMMRIQRFSQIYGETEGGTLMRAYMTSFMHQAENPQMLAYIGYTSDNKVVAHVLLSVAEWYGKRTACVVQYAVDSGYFSEEQWNTIWAKVKQWAVNQKCEEITAHVAYDSTARVRAFKTFRKMLPKDVILSMDLTKETQSCESTDD